MYNLRDAFFSLFLFFNELHFDSKIRAPKFNLDLQTMLAPGSVKEGVNICPRDSKNPVLITQPKIAYLLRDGYPYIKIVFVESYKSQLEFSYIYTVF